MPTGPKSKEITQQLSVILAALLNQDKLSGNQGELPRSE